MLSFCTLGSIAPARFWCQDWPWERGPAVSSCSRQGADVLQCGQRLWRASWSDCGLTTLNSDGVQWLALCI